MNAAPTVAILSYHRIGEPWPGGWETWYHVPAAAFESHLRHLSDAGWDVIDCDRFVRGLERPETLPRRAALITFDDAYRSTVTVALPLLERHACAGVVFVPTDYVGGTNRFDANTDHPTEPICSWDDLHELERRGVSVQSHGASHSAFSELTPEQIETELTDSKRVLEERLAKQVTLFAFPYGDSGTDREPIDAALRLGGYEAACLYGGGPVEFPPAHRFFLERLAIGSDTDLATELD